MSTGGESRPAGLPVPGPGTPVIPLRPIKTLALSCDLAVRPRVTTILGELGPTAFAICPVERPADVLGLALDQGADVLVLDVTLSCGRLLPILSVLAERVPDVGVVAIADRADAHVDGVPVVAKWGWATELAAAVRLASQRGNPLCDAGLWNRDA